MENGCAQWPLVWQEMQKFRTVILGPSISNNDGTNDSDDDESWNKILNSGYTLVIYKSNGQKSLIWQKTPLNQVALPFCIDSLVQL